MGVIGLLVVLIVCAAISKRNKDTVLSPSQTVEQAEDGAGFTDSIEKMTKGYKKIRKKMLVSNEKKEKQVRRNWIRNYVQANNLAVTAYKDYGWDPVSVR